MNAQEYQKLAKRTECDQWAARMRYASPIPDFELTAAVRLNHCMIGLISELGEILIAESKEEMKSEFGDMLWYLALGCNTLGFNMEEVAIPYQACSPLPFPSSMYSIMVFIGRFAGLIQKWLHYGQHLNVEKVKDCFSGIFTCITRLVPEDKIETLMKANINKLKVRYPDRYTDFQAADENRDRKKEAEAAKDIDSRD